MSFIPELLSPAGSLEKLKVAIDYGADAVYLAGLKFGLRSAAQNFTYEQLKEGVLYAHQSNSKVYVVLNGFLHDEDLEQLPEFVRYLELIKVDAVIVSDIGVMATVKSHSNIPIHLSTQASCVNKYAAKFWKRFGVERIVLGREVSITEAGKIKREVGVEVEMFIHGSMCMAYSGNCVISNFTQGRDSNRGGCAHSCRFEYSLDSSKKSAHFMSSKDLNGIKLLPLFASEQIDSLKIEGRMKSKLYAGGVTQAYARALKQMSEGEPLTDEYLAMLDEDLKKITHRSYAPVNLAQKAQGDTIYNERESSSVDYKIIGEVVEVEDQRLCLSIVNKFCLGDTLEILPHSNESFQFIVESITDLDGLNTVVTPSSILWVNTPKRAPLGSLVRARSE